MNDKLTLDKDEIMLLIKQFEAHSRTSAGLDVESAHKKLLNEAKMLRKSTKEFQENFIDDIRRAEAARVFKYLREKEAKQRLRSPPFANDSLVGRRDRSPGDAISARRLNTKASQYSRLTSNRDRVRQSSALADVTVDSYVSDVAGEDLADRLEERSTLSTILKSLFSNSLSEQNQMSEKETTSSSSSPSLSCVQSFTNSPHQSLALYDDSMKQTTISNLDSDCNLYITKMQRELAVHGSHVHVNGYTHAKKISHNKSRSIARNINSSSLESKSSSFFPSCYGSPLVLSRRGDGRIAKKNCSVNNSQETLLNSQGDKGTEMLLKKVQSEQDSCMFNWENTAVANVSQDTGAENDVVDMDAIEASEWWKNILKKKKEAENRGYDRWL